MTDRGSLVGGVGITFQIDLYLACSTEPGGGTSLSAQRGEEQCVSSEKGSYKFEI